MSGLFTSDFAIRPFREGDAAAFLDAALESVDSVGRWLPWCRSDYSLADAEQWIDLCARNLELGNAHSMGIFARDGGGLLGGIGINQINREHNFGQVGYWIRQSQQGRNLAARALQLMTRYGFETLGLSRLEVVVQVDNLASRRVAEKAGAAFEGIQANRLVVRGVPYAAAMYSLTPTSTQRR